MYTIYTHAYVSVQTFTHGSAYTYGRTWIYCMYTIMYVCMCLMNCKLIHTHAHTHTHTYACTHTHTHTRTCTYTHTLAHVHTHAHRLVYARTHTHTHIHLHAHPIFPPSDTVTSAAHHCLSPTSCHHTCVV